MGPGLKKRKGEKKPFDKRFVLSGTGGGGQKNLLGIRHVRREKRKRIKR